MFFRLSFYIKSGSKLFMTSLACSVTLSKQGGHLHSVTTPPILIKQTTPLAFILGFLRVKHQLPRLVCVRFFHTSFFSTQTKSNFNNLIHHTTTVIQMKHIMLTQISSLMVKPPANSPEDQASIPC